MAVATSVTIGYDVPWRRVHALLLAAARSVGGLCTNPEPFVLQISLHAFHISYELNAAVADVNCYRETSRHGSAPLRISSPPRMWRSSRLTITPFAMATAARWFP